MNRLVSAIFALAVFALFLSAGVLGASSKDPKALVARVVAEAGGADVLRKKGDVEYT